MPAKPVIYLIDASSQMHRAFHAPIRTAEGGLLRNAQGRPIAFYRHVGVGPTLATFGISTALGAVTNIAFNEFDVIGKLRKLLHK